MADVSIQAVQLTEAQLQVLHDDILADPAFVGVLDQEVADAYNLPASPDWTVWRSAVTAKEWRAAIIGGGGASQLDALAASKRDSLLWAVSDTLAPSVLAVRTALEDFCGSQNTLKAAIAAAQKRTATRAEKLFSTGTGSVAAPATMGFEGRLTYQDVEAARALA